MIIDQINELEVEFNKVTQGQSNAVAISNLDSVYQDMLPVLKELEVKKARREVCRNLPSEFALLRLDEEDLEHSKKALAAIAAFSTAWEELENKYEISQQDVSRNTCDAIANLNASLDSTITSAYQAWISQVRDDVSVSDSDLDKQDTVPNLKKNAAKYRSLIQKMQEAFGLSNPTTATIVEIRDLREQLLATRDNMEFHQPDDVIKLFKHLKQIGNNGRAPLSLLTDDVLKWMKTEGQESYFYVGDSRVR